jgi:hypothetical protein
MFCSENLTLSYHVSLQILRSINSSASVLLSFFLAQTILVYPKFHSVQWYGAPLLFQKTRPVWAYPRLSPNAKPTPLYLILRSLSLVPNIRRSLTSIEILEGSSASDFQITINCLSWSWVSSLLTDKTSAIHEKNLQQDHMLRASFFQQV